MLMNFQASKLLLFQKKAHKCGKPIIREVYSFRTTPPQTRLYKEVAYRLVGHFKDLSTYLSQIFLRQEPQQWKKGRHQYHWCYSSKRTFLHDWMKRSLAHIIRSAKKISPEPPVASSCVPDPSMVSAFRDLGKGDTAGFCRFGLGVIRKIWFWWLKPSEFINNQDLDFWSRARSK